MSDIKDEKSPATEPEEDQEEAKPSDALEGEERGAVEEAVEEDIEAAEESKEAESVEASDSLKSIMQEALDSVEAIERGEELPDETKKAKKKDVPEPPSKKELELKMQIIDLQHRVRELEKEVDKKIKEVKQNFDEAKRMQKQLEDYKVRVKREKADHFNYGQEPMIRETLPVLDNLERALAHARKPEEFESLREGIDLTLKQFLQALGKFGVERIEALGRPFDPNIHEAMGMCESSEVQPNTVMEEHQKGYMLKDRLIRPSMVIVSCPSEGKPAKSEQADAEKTGVSDRDSKDGKESALSEESPDNSE